MRLRERDRPIDSTGPNRLSWCSRYVMAGLMPLCFLRHIVLCLLHLASLFALVTRRVNEID